MLYFNRKNTKFNRFLLRQGLVYDTVLQELEQGKKQSHWIWYIFPQLRGLGRSRIAEVFGLEHAMHAREYLLHPVLGVRLRQCCRLLLQHKDKTAEEILGPVDARKLRASMTLFAWLSSGGSVFHQVLDQFFAGQQDPRTLVRLQNKSGFVIEDDILTDCFGMVGEIVVPEGVTQIREGCFHRNMDVHRVVLPQSVRVIGAYAFQSCYNLESIHIPDTVEQIGAWAFSSCTGLREIKLPEKLECIDRSLFQGCCNLTTAIIPKNLRSIAQTAFGYCKNLCYVGCERKAEGTHWDCCGSVQGIMLPDSVETVGEGAFAGCENLAGQAEGDALWK